MFRTLSMEASGTAFLVLLMIITGCASCLFNKAQDLVCVENCDAPLARDRVYFEQPYLQSINMFVGEVCCLFVAFAVNILQARNARITLSTDEEEDNGSTLTPRPKFLSKHLLLLSIPASLDIIGTTLLNVGLIYCDVSLFQMLRGGLVIWVALLSKIFLGKRFPLYKWLALLCVTLGVAVVGASGALAKNESEEINLMADSNLDKAVFGMIMILFSQLFTAAQYVVEEKIIVGYAIDPTLAVGCEGVFGLSIMLIGIVFLAFTDNLSHIKEGISQVQSNATLAYTCVYMAIGLAIFNYAGLSITGRVSSVARSTVDTCRTIGIWGVSLYLGWETWKGIFSFAQLLGFFMLAYGTVIFNEVISPPGFL